MNYLFELQQLNNRYFALRHGHSIANQQGIIVSDPVNGIDAYGLSPQGNNELRRLQPQRHGLDANARVISSDFRRARESAEIARELLRCEIPVVTDERLRERRFGSLELSTNEAYHAVWQADSANPDDGHAGSESANQVMARVTSLIIEYEQRLTGCSLLLVSHGDTLQLLQTAFRREDASRHRQLPHLDTAEIRELMLGQAHR